jgi:heptosyltransferase-2
MNAKATATALPASTPKKILILRYSSLGDVALANPLLDRLWQAWPDSEIYFATKKNYAPVVASHPGLSGVIPLEGRGLGAFWGHLSRLRDLQPALVLDLHDSLRTRLFLLFLGKARVLVYDKEAVQRRLIVRKVRREESLHTIIKYLKVLEPLGFRPASRINFEIYAPKKSHSFVREFMERKKISSSQIVVGLGPGAKWATKRWSLERYAELASRLVEDYRCQLFWFGSWEEIPLIHKIQSRMRGTTLERGFCVPENYSLEQSLALLSRCEIFIGNDSGLTHLASGRGCRVVVLYGSTASSLGFEPWGPHSVVEVAGLDCRPCDVHGKAACPLGHFKCMEDLTVDLVEGAVKRSLRRSR